MITIIKRVCPNFGHSFYCNSGADEKGTKLQRTFSEEPTDVNNPKV